MTNILNNDFRTDSIYKAIHKTNPRAAREYRDGALRRYHCVSNNTNFDNVIGEKWIISEYEKHFSAKRRRKI